MPIMVPAPKYFGSITAGDPLWIQGQTLHADPPSFALKKNDSVTWLVDDDVVAGEWDTKYDQSCERIESGSDSGHLLWDEYVSEMSGDCFSVKLLVQVKTTPSGTFFLLILPAYDTYTTGYGIALRPNTSHFDIVKMDAYETFSDLQTASFTFDSDKWYLVLFMKDTDNLKAKIWEWMEEEPGSWTVETTDSTYDFATVPGTQLANLGTCEAYVHYWAMQTGDSNYPADPYDLDGAPIDGDGVVEYGNDYGLGNPIDIAGSGIVPLFGDGEVDYSMETNVALAGTTRDQHVSGAVEYDSYYISAGDESTGEGDVEVDMSDLIIYHGLGGAQGGVVYACTVLGTGRQDILGDGEVTYPSGVVNGYSGFGGGVLYPSPEVAATGYHLVTGDGVITYHLQISGEGSVGTFSRGTSNVNVPSPTIRGTGRASNAGGEIDYPSALIAATGLAALITSGAVGYAMPELEATGYPTPDGDGEIDYEILVEGFASNDQCYHKLLEFVR